MLNSKSVVIFIIYFNSFLIYANDIPPDRHLCIRVAVNILNSFDSITQLFGVNLKQNAHILVAALTPLITYQNYEGMVFSASNNAFTFKVEALLGQGYWGTVHRIKMIEVSPTAIRDYPELFINGQIRSDLVVKLARRDSIVELSRRKAGLVKEAKLTKAIEDAVLTLGIAPYVYSKILFADSGREPFLIKPELTSLIDLKSILRDPHLMTQEMLDSLEKDIFAKSKFLHQETELSLDIHPGNLAWDPQQKRWVLYELQNIYGDHWVSGSFFEYLQKLYDLRDK